MEWRPGEDRNKTRSSQYYFPLSVETADLFRAAFKLSGGPWAFIGRDGEPLNPKVAARHWARIRHRLLKAGAPVLPQAQTYDAGRRHFRTALEMDLGVSVDIAELCLCHFDGGMRRRYMMGEMTAQIRAAHERYQAYFFRVILGDPPCEERPGLA